MIRTSISLNGDEKINKFVGSWQYYNYIQPYQHHTRTPLDGVNVYSNSLAPEELQPSGQMNLSRIKDVAFNFELDANAFFYYLSEVKPDIVYGSGNDAVMSTNLYFKMYAICYNILRLSNGYAALAFSAA